MAEERGRGAGGGRQEWRQEYAVAKGQEYVAAKEHAGPPSAGNPPIKGKDEDFILSGEKTEEQRQELAAMAPGQIAKVRFSHGEKAQWLKDLEAAQRQTAQDPWGNTPLQQRIAAEQAEEAHRPMAAVSGLSPQVTNATLPDDYKIQGTLPPV